MLSLNKMMNKMGSLIGGRAVSEIPKNENIQHFQGVLTLNKMVKSEFRFGAFEDVGVRGCLKSPKMKTPNSFQRYFYHNHDGEVKIFKISNLQEIL